jgi:tetratricopeptide (TPR) repeat protein
VSRWQQTALIGIARLTGSAALGASSGALLAAAVPDVLKILFEGADDARRRRARDFAVHVAGVIEVAIQERMDPGTLESGRLAASDALRTHGLTDGQVVALDLDPNRAARAVMEKMTFSAVERSEIAPLAEQVLVAFYRGLTTSPTVFPEFMPAIQAELLRRSTQERAALDDLRGDVQAGFATAEDAAERRHQEQMAAQRALMEAIAREKGVPIPPLRAVLDKLGHAEVAPEQIPMSLEAAADRLLELEDRLARPSNDRPETQAARAKSRALIDAGELDAAEAVLREARAGLRALREQTAREEAALLTDEAGVAATRLAFREAADFLGQAAALLDFDPPHRWRMVLMRGDRLYDLGNEFGDNGALREAASVYRGALALAPRERVPLDWAATQNNLGNALFRLGEQGDDAVLREAVAAYRAALEELTRDRVPLLWATTQTNLGNALRTLGERGDEAALRDAVAAYRAALKERTRERVPLDWAITQNNLGNALATIAILGGRRDDAALREAVAAYRAALEELTRDRVPLLWATTQNNLGNALATLGERGDKAALRDAVAAYRAALKERTRARVPLAWAMTQNNLGNALATLGELGDDAALRDAVAAYRAALEERTRERVPLDWAFTQENLALALRTQAQRTRDCALIAEGLTAIGGAIDEYGKRDAPHYLARAQRNRQRILATARDLGCP